MLKIITIRMLRKKIFRKYGNKQRNRIDQILHHISKDIVLKAKAWASLWSGLRVCGGSIGRKMAK